MSLADRIDAQTPLEALETAYVDNSLYEDMDSVDMALAFKKSCHLLLLRWHRSQDHGSERVVTNIQEIHETLKNVTHWLRMRRRGSARVLFTTTNWRDFGGRRDPATREIE